MLSLEQIGGFNAPVDKAGGLSSGLRGPEDSQQNLSAENPLTPHQNLSQDSTGKLALTEENILHTGAEQYAGSPPMEQVVKKLAYVHGVDLSQKGASLVLDMPRVSIHPDYWEIRNLEGKRIWITGWVRERLDGFPTFKGDLDIIFAIGEAGWEPETVLYTEQVYEDFMQAMEAQGRIVIDEYTGELLKDIYVDGEFPDNLFIDYWAKRIEQDRWIEQGRKRDRLSIFKLEDDEES